VIIFTIEQLKQNPEVCGHIGPIARVRIQNQKELALLNGNISVLLPLITNLKNANVIELVKLQSISVQRKNGKKEI